MAVLTKGYSFGATETVTAAKLHALVDSGSISGIQTTDISDDVITDDKINSVGGAKFTTLSAIPGGAGVIPTANIPNITGDKITALASLPSGAGFLPIANLASIPSSLLTHLASIPTNAGVFNYQSIVTSLASGGYPSYNGANNFVGANPATVDFTFVTSFNVSSNTTGTSGTVLAAGKRYLVVATLANDPGATGIFNLTINGDTGTTYKYVSQGIRGSDSGSITNNSASAAFIQLGNQVDDGIDVNISFILSPMQSNTSQHYSVQGKWSTADLSGISAIAFMDFYGQWLGSSDLSSIQINCDHFFTGTVYIYKLGN